MEITTLGMNLRENILKRRFKMSDKKLTNPGKKNRYGGLRGRPAINKALEEAMKPPKKIKPIKPGK